MQDQEAQIKTLKSQVQNMIEEKEKNEKSTTDLVNQCKALRKQNDELQVYIDASTFVSDLATTSSLKATISSHELSISVLKKENQSLQAKVKELTTQLAAKADEKPTTT